MSDAVIRRATPADARGDRAGARRRVAHDLPRHDSRRLPRRHEGRGQRGAVGRSVLTAAPNTDQRVRRRGSTAASSASRPARCWPEPKHGLDAELSAVYLVRDAQRAGHRPAPGRGGRRGAARARRDRPHRRGSSPATRPRAHSTNGWAPSCWSSSRSRGTAWTWSRPATAGATSTRWSRPADAAGDTALNRTLSFRRAR